MYKSGGLLLCEPIQYLHVISLKLLCAFSWKMVWYMCLYLKLFIKFNFSSYNSSIIAIVYEAEIKSYISFLKSDSLYK